MGEQAVPSIQPDVVNPEDNTLIQTALSAAEEEIKKLSLQLTELDKDYKVHLASLPGTMTEAVRVEFDRQIKQWSLSVGTAWKILGIAVFLLAGIVTLFAVKSAHDISVQIQDAVNKEVAQRVQDATPSSPFASTMRRAMVDSYLVSQERRRVNFNRRFQGRAGSELIAPDELTQFIQGFQDPKTKEEDFNDLARVLASTANSDAWPRASASLVSAILATDESFRWFRNEPRRRSLVLNLLAAVKPGSKDSSDGFAKVQSVAVTTLTPGTDHSLQLSAIRFLATYGNKDCVAALEQAIETNQDETTQFEIAVALAGLAPLDPAFDKYLQKLNKEPPDVDSVKHHLLLLSAVASRGPGMSEIFMDSNRRKELAESRSRLTQQLAHFGMGNNVKLIYQLGFDEDDLGRIAIAKGGRSSADPRLSNFVVQHALSVVPELVANSKSLKELHQAVELFTIYVSEFDRKTPATRLTTISVNLTDRTKVETTETGVLERSKLEGGLTLEPSGDGLFAIFTKKSGELRREKLLKLADVVQGDVDFTVSDVLLRRLAFDEELDLSE